MEKKLIKEAIKARENAYCPYSNFKVGAAVLFEDGNIYTGSNVENASYGATMCAERVAIFNGVAKGNKSIKALALIGDVNNYTYPCGMCRQVISEFAHTEDVKIYIVKNEEDYLVKTFGEIMPGSFTKRDLE
ncbi:MAG: cytidine deaminase [Clostridium sp.]|uniref:cytidine deaminase n=1 Tax=Clostridium sp. TaxID=1506 RepID=UPI003F2B994D